MSTISIDFPKHIAASLNRTPTELARDMRLYTALMLFQQGKLSSGMAAQLAGIQRVEFLHLCGEYNIPVLQQSAEDLDAELADVFNDHL